MEYPHESAPPLFGEDGGEFPAPSLVGRGLEDLPLSLEVGTLEAQPPPDSSMPGKAGYYQPIAGWSLTHWK